MADQRTQLSIFDDFFNSSKPFVEYTVPTGVVNGAVNPELESESSEEEDEVQETGTDYVQEYQKKELATYEYTPHKGRTLTNVSSVNDLITPENRTEFNQLKEESVLRVYKEYSFNTKLRTHTMPIETRKTEILNHLQTTQAIIIHGPTGCGKTTQVPQFIVDHFQENNRYCNIVVTQPRRIAAISVAKRVCEERNWALGSVCGYQVGLEKQCTNDTILNYVTTGVLLQKLARKKNLCEYTHIIIDEVHERTQEMDFLLLIIRRYLYTNSHKVKVILMSATFDTDKFSYYFRIHGMGKEIRAPTIFVTKESHYDTQYYYLDQLRSLDVVLPEFQRCDPRMFPEIFEILVRLIIIFDKVDEYKQESDKIGHVLVFLPGIYEIEEAYKRLMQAKETNQFIKTQWWIIPLHSSITNHEQRQVFQIPSPGTRKIILSTNIAESSITVADIEYVIDSCLTKAMVVDPNSQQQSLKLEWASQVNCVQRSGRVGRVRDGRVYRLVTQEFYEDCLSKDIKPEMLRAPLERIVLCTKLLDMYEPPKAILALAIDPPHLENIETTIFNLKEAGALLSTCRGEVMKIDGDLTFLGHIMASLPLDIKLSKMICLGYMFCCLEESIIMAAGCSLSNIFTSPFQEKLKSYTNRLTWAHGSSSDLISYLNLFKVWDRFNRTGAFKRKHAEIEWCAQNYLSYRSIREWNILVTEIKDRLNRIGIKESIDAKRVILGPSELPLIIKVVISGAFYPNYFKRALESGQPDEREAVKTLNGLSPTNTVYFTNMDASQPGPLYAKRIKEILQPCSKHVNINFSTSSKVYVTFLDTSQPHSIVLDGEEFIATMPGKISFDVYKAIKMRQVSPFHALPVMKPADSWRIAKEIGIALDTKGGNYKLTKKSSENSNISLPGPRDLTMFITITHVVDAGHFYAQFATEEIERHISMLDDILNPKDEPLELVPGRVVIGDLYAALYPEDKKYYRCKILAIFPYKGKEPMAQISFIDFGNTAAVNVQSLRVIPAGFARQIPALGMECVLSEIQPSILRNPRGLWSQEATEVFVRCTSQFRNLSAKIYSVVGGVVSVELLKEGSKMSLNRYLINTGYAEEAQESFLSKENNVKRTQAQNYDYNTSVLEFDEDYDCKNLLLADVEPPEISICHDTVKLKGPYSPLEMKLYSCIDDIEAVVDGTSVNTVLLDADVHDPYERLLVAVSISQKVNSKVLVLRHTTMMPNVHGFPALMSLVFCPRMVPKPVEDGSCFGGILCGLGEHNRKPLHPIHDVAITLDTELSEQDLVKINEIRYWMNRSVSSMEMICNDERPPQAMEECQHQLKNLMMTLLKTKRQPQERQFVKHPKSWTKFMYDGRLLKPGVTFIDKEIWPLHWSMELATSAKGNAKIKKHLENLHDMAKNVKPMSEITCTICDFHVNTINQLRLHLSSAAHKQKESCFQVEK